MARIAVTRIVSGGQTGADRGGLDAAIALGVPHGGWCPKGRKAEDGRIPARYLVRELDSADYAARTERNVIDSDGTLIVSRGGLTGGSALTRTLAHRRGRPVLHIDLAGTDEATAVRDIRAWLTDRDIGVLNVAGPRASNCPGIGEAVYRLMCRALAPDRGAE